MGISVLTKILEHKKCEIARLERSLTVSEIRARAEEGLPVRDFASALLSPEKPRIIAEIKKASPSKGVIAKDFDPVLTGKQYQQNGAAAVSVLTDERFFKGDLSYLPAVKKEILLPVLRKDFLINSHQIYESRAAGADAVLLIVAAMQSVSQLSDLLELSRSLGMESLVEVHTESEVEKALEVRSNIIGINNRNLDNFDVNLSVSGKLAPMIRKDKITVSESGINSPDDMRFLAEYGVDAFLIGESFMKSSSPGESLSGMIDGWRQ